MAIDDIGREDVVRQRVRVAEEVGKGYGREGVVVSERAFEEFDHDSGITDEDG